MYKRPYPLLAAALSFFGLGSATVVDAPRSSDPFGPGGKIPRSSTPSYIPRSGEPDWVQARFRTPVPPSTPTRQSVRHAERMAEKAGTRRYSEPRQEETFGKVGGGSRRGVSWWDDRRKRPHDWSGAGWE